MEMSYTEIYRKTAAAFPIVRRVIESFNGKCFNCRLNNALKEAISQEIPGSYIYCEKKNERALSINYCVPGANGSRGWQSICWIPVEKAFTDGKRINAAAIIDAMREKRAELLKKAYDIEETGRNAESIKAQLEQIKSAYNHIVDSIPYEAREEYKIKCQHLY